MRRLLGLGVSLTLTATVLLSAPLTVQADHADLRGPASTYGPGYEGLFALPRTLGGRGETVRICSVDTGRCLVRTSNDVGPVERLHRVADLDVTDFEYLCRCAWRTKGVQEVTLEYLKGGPAPRQTLPPTDTGGRHEHATTDADGAGRFLHEVGGPSRVWHPRDTRNEAADLRPLAATDPLLDLVHRLGRILRALGDLVSLATGRS